MATKLFSSGKKVPWFLLKAYDKAFSMLAETGKNQSIVTMNGRVCIVSCDDINAVKTISSQLGGKYRGSVVTFKNSIIDKLV